MKRALANLAVDALATAIAVVVILGAAIVGPVRNGLKRGERR